MLPKKQGLYSPEYEHDNCGAGFICSLRGEKTNNIIPKALNILTCLEHRGAGWFASMLAGSCLERYKKT